MPGFALALFSNKPYFKWFFAPLFIFAIFATGSRAVELSSIFVIFSYVYHRSDKKIYLIPACIVVIAILVVFFDQIVTNKNYNNSRYVIAKITFNIAKENLINGIGYGQFRKSFRFYVDQNIYNMSNNDINDTLRAYTNEYGWSASVGQNSNQLSPYAYNQSPVQEKMTHNDLLTVVAELGLLGITCVVFLFYKLYIELQKLLFHNREHFFFSIGLIGGSLIFSLFHNNLTSFVFWFVLFIPFIMNRNCLLYTSPSPRD
mgnify:CR=1 FL=1